MRKVEELKQDLQKIADKLYALRDEMRRWTYSDENDKRYTDVISRANDAIALLDDLKQWGLKDDWINK